MKLEASCKRNKREKRKTPQNNQKKEEPKRRNAIILLEINTISFGDKRNIFWR